MAEGKKHDQNKLRPELISPEMLEQLAGVLTYGAIKYGDFNWQKGLDADRIYGALLRHLIEYHKDKDSIDSETGMLHISHALCNVAFLVWYCISDTDYSIEDSGTDWEMVIKRWKKNLGKEVNNSKQKTCYKCGKELFKIQDTEIKICGLHGLDGVL